MKVNEITVGSFNASLPYYYLVNEDDVTYKSNDLDVLLRFFCQHTQRKATLIGKIG